MPVPTLIHILYRSFLPSHSSFPRCNLSPAQVLQSKESAVPGLGLSPARAQWRRRERSSSARLSSIPKTESRAPSTSNDDADAIRRPPESLPSKSEHADHNLIDAMLPFFHSSFHSARSYPCRAPRRRRRCLLKPRGGNPRGVRGTSCDQPNYF